VPEEGGAQPLQPLAPAPPSGFRLPRWLPVAGAGLVAAGAIGALAVGLLLKSGPGTDRMIPVNASLYATVYLSPSVPQKANLLRLAHRFPDLRTDQQLTSKLNSTMNEGLKETGLSFEKDIQPWLGSRLSAVAQFSDHPSGALLFDAKDDAKAIATLARLRTTPQGKQLSWSDSTYNGVTVSTGTGKGSMTTVYAFLDHTAVVASSVTLLQDIIDTDKGKGATLFTDANYQATVALLPSDRLVLAYVSGPSLLATIKTEVTKQATGSLTVPDSAWQELAAFRGLGMTLAAGTDGLSGELEVKLDASKLSAATRQSLTQSSHRNALLQWVPQRAFGVVSSTGIKTGIQSALAQPGTLDAQTKQSLEQFGVLGSNGVIAHLTGDLAVEVEETAPRSLGGAFLVGTNDAPGMQIFLTKIATLVQLSGGTGSLNLNTLNTPVEKSTYHGVTITSFPIPDLGVPGVAPAFAVTGGVGILASSPAEIRAIIDAQRNGGNITSADHFVAASAATFRAPQGFFYLDVSEATTAILDYAPAASLSSYDAKAAANLAPVKAVLIASQGSSDRISERIFILIPN
jgi:hypothetical protein